MIKVTYQGNDLTDAGSYQEQSSAQSVDDQWRDKGCGHLNGTNYYRRHVRIHGATSCGKDTLHVKENDVDTGQLLKRCQEAGEYESLKIGLYGEQIR